MNPPIKDFPKIKSPFKRTEINGRYVLTPEIEEGYEWIFDDGVLAVDKLHGTNICINISDGYLQTIDNRENRMMIDGQLNLKGNSTKFAKGVLNAAQKFHLEDGRHYGELIGPDINGNLHGSDDYLFVPFNYLQRKCHWISWVSNKYPKDFNSISDWFKELPSLFSQRVFKKDVLAEGLILWRPPKKEDGLGSMAKLRRDMFDWYEGPNHGD